MCGCSGSALSVAHLCGAHGCISVKNPRSFFANLATGPKMWNPDSDPSRSILASGVLVPRDNPTDPILIFWGFLSSLKSEKQKSQILAQLKEIGPRTATRGQNEAKNIPKISKWKKADHQKTHLRSLKIGKKLDSIKRGPGKSVERFWAGLGLKLRRTNIAKKFSFFFQILYPNPIWAKNRFFGIEL